MIRKLLLLLIAVIVPTCGWANSWEDLVHRNGLLFERFSDTPFSGDFTGQFQGKLNEGVFEGEWRFFLPDGQLALKINFEAGVPVGEFEAYDESGQLLERSGVSDSWKGIAELFEVISKLWDQDVYESVQLEKFFLKFLEQDELDREESSEIFEQSVPEKIEGYITNIRREVVANWIWAGDSNGLRVSYFMTLSESGGLVSLSLRQSSGNRAFDESVEKAIYVSSPFQMPNNKKLFLATFGRGVTLSFEF